MYFNMMTVLPLYPERNASSVGFAPHGDRQQQTITSSLFKVWLSRKQDLNLEYSMIVNRNIVQVQSQEFRFTYETFLCFHPKLVFYRHPVVEGAKK